MYRQPPSSQAAVAATRHPLLLVEDIYEDLPSLGSTRPQSNVRQRLWFIPDIMYLPPCLQNGPSHSKRRDPSHVPRPRNAFILFRSVFVNQGVLPATIEFCRDHRQVSRIVSNVWKVLPSDEKERFYQLGDEEKRVHQKRYPEYKITARKDKSKQRARHTPFEESNLSPAVALCAKIAEIIVNNIQGQDLASRIKEVVEATPLSERLDLTPVSPPSKVTTPKNDELDVDTYTSNSSVTSTKSARKGKKGRANKSQSLSKIRSPTSKIKQSKATVNVRAPRVPFRREITISDIETTWYKSNTGHQADCTLSEDASFPPSVTPGSVSNPSSMNSSTGSSSRRDSPGIVGEVQELYNWDMDMTVQKMPFDQEISFDTYHDSRDYAIDETSTYAAFGIHYPNGLHGYDGTQQFPYHELYCGQQYEDIQMAFGHALFNHDRTEVAEPHSISPDRLL